MSNKFVSFLKAAEQKIASVIRIAAKAEPAALAIADTAVAVAGAPELIPLFNKIGSILAGAGGVVETLNASSGNGLQKLQIATPMVDNLIKNSGFLNDKQIADEAKYAAAVQSITSSFADLFNALAPVQPPPPAA